MATRPSINEFYQAAQTYGFGKKYNFQVVDITGINDIIKDIPEYNLFVRAATLPSRKINTTTVPFRSFDFTVPTNASYPESQNWSLEFFSDDNLLIRKLFEKWSLKVYNEQTLTGSDNSLNSILQLNVISENLEGEEESVVYTKYKLYGVFPTVVGGMEYDISDTGTNLRFRATLVYQYFKQEGVEKEPV